MDHLISDRKILEIKEFVTNWPRMISALCNFQKQNWYMCPIIPSYDVRGFAADMGIVMKISNSCNPIISYILYQILNSSNSFLWTTLILFPALIVTFGLSSNIL